MGGGVAGSLIDHPPDVKGAPGQERRMMKLVCPQDQGHRRFIRESSDHRGGQVNVALVDAQGRFIGGRLDLSTGGVTYRYFCLEGNVPAAETD